MKWGIMATGNIANKFAKTINALEGEELIAVASRDINKAKDFAKLYNIPSAYGSYEELAKDKNIDIIYIATPNNMHFDNSKMCLENGKHVLCEKPFTYNHKDAKELYKLSCERNLFIMEALWIRFLPMYKHLKENISRIGNIKSIEVSYGFDTNPTRKLRKFDKSLGGGALLDIGVYTLGFIQMIMEDIPDDVKSMARLNDYGTDEYSEITLRYGDTVAKATTTIGMDIKREAFIKGDKGEVYIPDFQSATSYELTINNNKEMFEFPFEINGFEYQIRDVVESISNGLHHSLIYTDKMSIELMKLMYEIRVSWRMYFGGEKK